MGAVYPSIANIIASSTAVQVDPTSSTLTVAGPIAYLAQYLALPVIFWAFVCVVTFAGIIYFRKGLLKVIRRVTGKR